MPATSLDERVHRILATGDSRGAAEAALRGLTPAVRRYLRSTLREEALAADAFSEFAEDLWRGLPGFRGDAPLERWAFRLARRAALRVRAEGWRRRRCPLSAVPVPALAGESRPATCDQRARELRVLRARLSREEQLLVALRVDQARPWADIAQIVADDERVGVDALMKRFQRLKGRLATMAREERMV